LPYFASNRRHQSYGAEMETDLAKGGEEKPSLRTRMNNAVPAWPSQSHTYINKGEEVLLYRFLTCPPYQVAMSSSNQIYNPPNHPPFAPTYSHIARVPISSEAELITFAGQVGADSTTGEIPSTLGEQVKIALANVDTCLKAAGATKKDIIQVRHYVVNLHPVDSARAKYYSEWMEGNKPPSTLVGVQSLAAKELLYEIEVVAVVRKG
jgi:enamine deaminase RidA (YjgF/YER057c/UK114 family)